MKIVYRKSILTQVRKAIHTALEKNTPIDHFEFTRSEVQELRKELEMPPAFSLCSAGSILGVTFKVIDDEPIAAV